MTGNHIETYPKRLARRSQRWRWRAVINGRNVANSGEGYANRKHCEAIATSIFDGAYAHLPIVRTAR